MTMTMAMNSQPSLSKRKRRVFDSVFGSVNIISQPTPVATPASQFTAPGQIFGVPVPQNHETFPQKPSSTHNLDPRKIGSYHVEPHVEDQVQWDRAWHLVTRTLSVPDFPRQRGILEALQPERGSLGQDFYDALEVVLYPQTFLPLARQTEDLVIWHTSQVRQHFLQQILPVILQIRNEVGPADLLSRGLKVLETAHRLYFHGLSYIKEQLDESAPETSNRVVERFSRDLHSVVSNSAVEPLSTSLIQIVQQHVFTILGLALTKDHESHNQNEQNTISPEGGRSEQARRELLALIQSLKNVGLAGEKLEVIFADIMNDAMSEYVQRGYKGVWSIEELDARNAVTASRGHQTLPRTTKIPSPSRCVACINEWIEYRYAKIAVQVLNVLDNKNSISWADKEKFQEMATGRLAELRIHELFDIVGRWQSSSGALDDLRSVITTSQRRLHLTGVFERTLSDKLLHPGASTLEILRTYINMIWSFHALDQSKVLLDRVAYPLQLYLCSREDTVRIIITGLLSDTEDTKGNPITTSKDRLVELAHLLNEGPKAVGRRANVDELDWHDMDWVPDPVDAGPGYKRSKDADIIGTMIGVLGSQDVFIKEFQNIIGENLLRNDGTFEKEIKVLELLKIRFGEAPLQACEVMLKDIQDSARVNGVIRKNQRLDPSEQELQKAHYKAMGGDITSPEGLLKPSLNAKILSRLFWPQLHDEDYKIPEAILELQKKYEEGFEALKSARKLTWLNALGQATVELEFQDRTVVEEVHTYQATVIYHFQNPDPSGQATSWSISQLEEALSMDETLIRSALRFWSKKLVLVESGPDTYSVLETLNKEDRARSKAQNSSSGSSNRNENEESVETAEKGMGREKEAMYWQFIQGMLKNSSKEMGLAQIAMMLKMLIVEGFPYSNEELAGFLGGKVEQGGLELVGGKYRLRK